MTSKEYKTGTNILNIFPRVLFSNVKLKNLLEKQWFCKDANSL